MLPMIETRKFSPSRYETTLMTTNARMKATSWPRGLRFMAGTVPDPVFVDVDRPPRPERVAAAFEVAPTVPFGP